MRWLTLTVALTLALAIVVPACGNTTGRAGFPAGDGGDSNDGGSSNGSSSGFGNPGGGTSSGFSTDGGIVLGNDCDGGGSDLNGGTITAAGGNNIVVNGQSATVQITAKVGNAAAVGIWNTSNNIVGTVDNNGVFHTSGNVAGSVDVILVGCNSQLSVTLNVSVDITDNSGNLSTAAQSTLKAGGASNPNFKFLYPFDQTVFPLDFQPPVLQFGDGVTVNSTATGTYLKLTTTNFSYQQFASNSSPVQINIPAAVWNGVTVSAGATGLVTAAVNIQSGGSVTGPLTENWHVAQGTLRGFIYYSTYKSPLIPWNNATNTGGGILRIQPGSAAQVVQTGCTVCHSISANGSVLAAAVGPDLSNPTSSVAETITNASTTPGPLSTGPTGQQYAMAALTPDGTKALTNGNPGLAPPYVPHGLLGAFTSILVNTATGQPVPNAVIPVQHVQTPAFSPDGKHVVFIDGDMAPTTQPLSLMDFDGTSVFSNEQTLLTETEMTTHGCWDTGGQNWTTPTCPGFTNPCVLDAGAPPPAITCQAQPQAIAYPSFTPDSAAVVYHVGDSFDSAGQNSNSFYEQLPQQAELQMVELNGTVKTLNAVNGRDANGVSTLPYGESVDNSMNYEPNVMPLPVGGYFWVVFTSRRSYGNTIAPGRAQYAVQPYDQPEQDPFGSNAGPSPRKKLWVAAIDINHAASGDADPSHPAFYLSGQEVESANMRAFAALAPCEQNGATCVQGTDCCQGYCRQTGNDSTTGAPILACVPPPMNTCSNAGEPCTTASQCCNRADLCIGGVCAQPPPPQ